MRREGGQVRAAEAGRRGSVGHVEVFRTDGVGTSVVGRPRRLSADRRSRPTYTLIWEEPAELRNRRKTRERSGGAGLGGSGAGGPPGARAVGGGVRGARPPRVRGAGPGQCPAPARARRPPRLGAGRGSDDRVPRGGLHGARRSPRRDAGGRACRHRCRAGGRAGRSRRAHGRSLLARRRGEQRAASGLHAKERATDRRSH
ncbi:hypothetical protein C5C41_15090 [Rathayibacter sp. AY1E9]|nr:hypothetical protein C5C30_14775 [Rathayibacter sp. AY2B5]PPG49687.1 hypothetical protein C5C41_15090 [Rathayibacter sp. AY1E9]PPG58065.1 hypothetical protein C5C57_10860 [Rathayibacter sp. AY1C5]PPH14812.1 hypothetical protein C5C35_14285 [Rathayibacter sp. AY1F8]PPH40926.1 hypothetical protein C5C86_09195 [Rathayibacter sp. AY1E4]PPH75398.1 hypothetical protein C5C90_07900 [Rathayibacter sp. AY1D4]PPH90463.1 hypothetical protein C5C64_07155 [Rathayibacter sp. AY1D3]